MSELSSRKCTPCREGMPPLAPAAAEALLRQLDGWAIGEGPRLRKRWSFPDFASALDFVNGIGSIADAEDHHPDIALGWGRVEVELWTHAAGGLTDNDFIVAARIDEIGKPADALND